MIEASPAWAPQAMLAELTRASSAASFGKTLAEIGVQVDGSLGHSSRSPRRAANSAGSIGSKRIRSPARIGK